MAVLRLEGVRKSFGAVPVLHGIDLALNDGEMLVIVGASGCGKSTLLRLVAGLEAPSAGRILLDGRDITTVDPAARDIAMVFQNYALYPHMTVFDNMAYALRIRGLSGDDIRRRVEATAAILDLSALLARKPRQLSGGQRQRVAMGRAIVREAKLFLFDEPLSNLDARLRVQMRAEIRRLQRRLGITSLYVTHDQTEAMTLGDRLLMLHQGRPVQLGTPMEIYARPADVVVAGFIGSPAMNLLPATLSLGGGAARLADGHVIVFADGARPGGDGHAVLLGIRPEDVVTDGAGEDAKTGDAMALAVDLVEPLGAETLVHGRLPGGESLTIRRAGAAPVGTTLRIAIPADRLHIFDATSGARLEARDARAAVLTDAAAELRCAAQHTGFAANSSQRRPAGLARHERTG